MQIAINDNDIDEFIGIINRIAQDHPILVDKYLQGKEIEVDAVCDGDDILIPGIMEHIERAGLHSGDSISVYQAQSLTDGAKAKIAEYTRRHAKSLHEIGMINIQYIVCCEEDVYVNEVKQKTFIEVNESGTEAAAVTMADMNLSMDSPAPTISELRYDHPFGNVLKEKSSGAILFAGRVDKPTI